MNDIGSIPVSFVVEKSFITPFFWGDHLTQANGTPNAAVSLHRFLYQVKTSVLGDAVS